MRYTPEQLANTAFVVGFITGGLFFTLIVLFFTSGF